MARLLEDEMMMRLLLCTAVSLFAVNAPAADKSLKVTWLGHAAFEIVTPGGTNILVDPFITPNPKTPAEFKDLARYKPNAILVTHSHDDHDADAMAIAKQSGAAVVSTVEYVTSLGLPEKQAMGGNVGGSFTFGDATVSLVPAMHSSEPSGRPLGFIIALADGRSIYHTGDTWVFSDMQFIQDLYRPTVILLNVGGGPYTQNPRAAAMAIKKFFNPKTIVPMHFGTFPGLATEEDVKTIFLGDKRMKIMKPGETATF
jgi:L-ascorbate metabolism protein UlaG (beta-lactamase superfamily)